MIPLGRCYICGKHYELGRTTTCSDECHEVLVQRLVNQFGEYRKVVRSMTGEAFKVPTRDIIDQGVKEQGLDKYPKWEDALG